jgi:protease-4
MFTRIRKLIGYANPIRGILRTFVALSNWRRRRFKKLDYITFILPRSLPPLPEPRTWLHRRVLGAPRLSLWELERRFERIVDDPRPKGVILHLRGFAMPLADLQTLRNSILRLRQRGKKVVCFAQSYDNATYYVASAADQTLFQPGGSTMTLGFVQRSVFLKDALGALGVSLDVVAISPFKTAYDT